jgi:metal-responsive CopG/Arc/MetJ family transcriptional regulator
MKKRDCSKSSQENIKIPVSVSISFRELRAIDKIAKRKGFDKRSHYIMSLVSRDVKRNGISIK